jgi:hypothetical protein
MDTLEKRGCFASPRRAILPLLGPATHLGADVAGFTPEELLCRLGWIAQPGQDFRLRLGLAGSPGESLPLHIFEMVGQFLDNPVVPAVGHGGKAQVLR